MTTDALLAEILAHEKGFVNDPNDRGGATNFGITAVTLGAWRRLGRQATIAEVQHLQPAEAKNIYRAQYVTPFDVVPFDELKANLVDAGVMSGVFEVKKILQAILGVPADGVFGPRTTAAMAVLPWRLVNASLVAARVKLYVQLVDERPQDLEFFHGWCKRASTFDVVETI